ncbi:MAG: hypothetical protein IK062_07025 [Selenomonadaceae bacterium]|nr:hypothetical protein [Selenomonadaceae bacterium]
MENLEISYTTRIINYALQTSGFYPLRPIQHWLIDTHFNKAKSTMMNIGVLYKYKEDTDLERLAKAINETVAAHDIFRCRLVFHEGTSDLCQRFDGEIFPVTVEKISDEEFETAKKDLMKPYRLINNPLYRIRLFETPSGKFGYLDFYHAIMDGMSIVTLFQREVEQRYKGKKINREALKYSEYILEEFRVSPEELAAGNQYWREMLKDFDETKHLPPADLEESSSWKSKDLYVTLKNISADYFSGGIRKENIFFLAASMLALAKSANTKNSIMSWIHNGRMNARERRLIGIMLEQYPISWDFSDNRLTIGRLLDDLEEKMNVGMKHRKSLSTVYGEGLQDDCATFIFQKQSLGAYGPNSGSTPYSSLSVEVVGLPENKYSAAENSLDIEISSSEEKIYYLRLDYDASRYSEGAMKKFAEILDEIVLSMQNERKLISEIL